jgi:hypothetical protein
MAYNTKQIKRDLQNCPIPQFFNPDTDEFEPLYGKAGGSRVLLYDAAGNPLLTAANPAYFQAEDGKIATLGAKADEAVTDPTLSASEIALLKGLLKQLQGAGSGAVPTPLTGRKARVYLLSGFECCCWWKYSGYYYTTSR